MAGGRQLPIDFTHEELVAHLARCGLSRVQAALVALVFCEGELHAENEQIFRCLRVSSRNAAGRLRSTSSSVVEAAGRVEKMGLMRTIREGRGRPPLYVVDCLAVRSLAPPEDRLDELVAAPDMDAARPLLGTARQCSALLGGAPVPVEIDLQNSCPPVPVPGKGSVRGNGEHDRAAASTTEQRTAGRKLPWSSSCGFTNEELAGAVRRREYGWLAALYDEAVGMGWIRARRVADVPDSDAWLRFLTLASCAARRPYHSKRRAMIAAVKRGRQTGGHVDVSRTSIADEQWAQDVASTAWRDAELAELRLSTDWRENDAP